MSAHRCPEGHDSASADYCDVCGAPINPTPDPVPRPKPVMTPGHDSPRAATPATACPNCAAPNASDATYCEDCGADLATGAVAAASPNTNSLDLDSPVPGSPSAATTTRWVAEVWVDPDWYAVSGFHDDPCPSAGPPRIVRLGRSTAMIGRRSESHHIRPDIDGGTDSSISRRHATLTRDGERWFIEDLQSTNGTFVSAAGAPLPTQPLAALRIELGDNDRIYVGAWTRIVVRRSIVGEVIGDVDTQAGNIAKGP